MSTTTTIPARDDRIVWIDLEMTGLEPKEHVIVEVAALVTDANLNILGEGIDLVVHASTEELSRMDSYVTEMHTRSGLVEAIKQSTCTIEQAEDAVLALIAEHCDPAHPAPLAGNSISCDRSFIHAYMPRLDEALHYRMIDVSTVKELSRRWAPRVYYHQPEKGLQHRALADIVESIRELDYYRHAWLKPQENSAECEAAQTEITQAYQRFL
ncbi:MAG: oligoribonuclease [Corynebacterium sp.]|nr:oligoribonuclease [Corynebacterium sp.]